MTPHILFVCTGNTCRSPLAEALARAASAARGLDVRVASAGTGALDGAPASDGSMLVGLERGLDLSTHRARSLTRELVADATLVLCMGSHHLDRALALGGEGKAFLLTEWASRGGERRSISDPFGGGLDIYRATAEELDAVIALMLDRIVEQAAE